MVYVLYHAIHTIHRPIEETRKEKMRGLNSFVFGKTRNKKFQVPQPFPNHKTMIRRVLICEDIDSVNIGLTKTLSDAFSFQVEQAQYCDKALLMVKNALMDEQPYDLIITDLSIKTRGYSTQTPNGEALLREVRTLQPGVKSIIYSMEDRPFKIQQYLESLNVDAYVLKGRESSLHLIEAIKALQEDDRYLSPELSESIQNTSGLDIEEYDLLLLKSLSEGYSQQEISKRFKKESISPHSLSSIEKRVNRLKEAFSARNIPNLIALAKDMGLI